MSTRSLEESCNEEGLPDLKPGDKESSPSQPDLDDVCSISSGSPCPIKDAQTKGKPTDVFSNQTLDKPGVLGHLQHASPLESIRELVETEERSEGRSPGDGAGRVMDLCTSTAIRYVALPSEEHGDVLERSSFTDDAPVGSCPPEDTSYMAMAPGHLECGSPSMSDHHRDVAGHRPASSHTSSDDDQSNITPVQDPREASVCPQTGVKVHSVSDESEKNNGILETVDDYGSEKEGSAANQTLVEVLTACEARVEQLEELKSSSIETSAQLQSSRLLAARLHQRVLSLEHQCHLKDRELHDTTVDLKKTSEALQTRNSEMAAIAEELRRLQLDLEAQKKAAAAAAAAAASGRTVAANGQLAGDARQRDGASRVCTLL